MSDRAELIRGIRDGVERLRAIALRETDPKLVTALTRIADELDAHSAELESSPGR